MKEKNMKNNDMLALLSGMVVATTAVLVLPSTVNPAIIGVVSVFCGTLISYLLHTYCLKNA